MTYLHLLFLFLQRSPSLASLPFSPSEPARRSSRTPPSKRSCALLSCARARARARAGGWTDGWVCVCEGEKFVNEFRTVGEWRRLAGCRVIRLIAQREKEFAVEK